MYTCCGTQLVNELLNFKSRTRILSNIITKSRNDTRSMLLWTFMNYCQHQRLAILFALCMRLRLCVATTNIFAKEKKKERHMCLVDHCKWRIDQNSGIHLLSITQLEPALECILVLGLGIVQVIKESLTTEPTALMTNEELLRDGWRILNRMNCGFFGSK